MTEYFLLDSVGSLSLDDHCFVPNGPKGGALTAWDLKVGRSAFKKYPNGLGDVTLRLGDEFPGLELSSFLSNADGLLAVDRGTAAIIQSHKVGEMEVIPFKLINHKGRVHSTDYVFLNPIGWIDALDMDKSVLKRNADGKVLRVKKPVLSRARLASAPDLFRVNEMVSGYVFSQTLVDDLSAKGCTNFAFNKLEQA